MPKVKWDKDIRMSTIGRKLYRHWCNVHRDTDEPLFEEYDTFYAWSMENGYKLGARLVRRDATKPYNPENCFWIWNEKWCTPQEKQIENNHKTFAMVRAWDEAVNRIRQHYGMEPIRSSEEYYAEAK